MKKSAIPAILIGLILAVTLIMTNDAAQIVGALAGAGWGIALVLALHLPQTLASAMGWRALLDRPQGVAYSFLLRWVREAVNSLLPVAQLGGDVVRARLLSRRGPTFVYGVAVSMVDLAAETVNQAAFTLTCLVLLFAGPHLGDVVPITIATATICIAMTGGLVIAQRFGLMILIERLVERVTRGKDFAGLHGEVVALYRHPARLIRATGWHLVSWFLGGAETYLALHLLGVDASVRQAVIIEGLSQVVRSAAFLIPGALGVQEGGYILLCGMLGIAPQRALALSLIRRIRELGLGLPGLAIWSRMEAQPRSVLVEAAQ